MKRILAIAGLWLASIIPSSAAVFILQAPVAQTGAVPAVTTDGTPEAYVGNGPAIILENTLAIACTCSTLSSATVTISSGAFSGDVLAAPTQVGITNSFTSNTLTLTGTAAISTYLSVLQAVTYSSSNVDPTNSGSNLTRTITWNVVNGSNPSNSPTTTVNVTAGSPPPTLTPSGSVSTFTSGGAAVALDGGITLTCSCSNLTSATLTVSSGLLTGDSLVVVTPGSLTTGFDSAAGVLTLTGTATLATYQTAFRSITYSSTLADPTNSGADPSRTINWVANNSTSSGLATTTVNIQNPSVPTINLGPNNAINFTAGGSPLVVNSGINTTCSCANYTSATLTLSSGFFAGDILAATTSLGITTVYNSSTGVMTFTGNTTVANYQTLLRTITYSSSSGDPSNGGLNQSRVATWVVFNGANASAPVTTRINVFIAGQPSWVMTGAQVALNPATDQSWVNGLGVGPLSAEITTTRASTKTCYTGQLPVAVTFAAPNTECATNLGLAVHDIYTNYARNSTDMSQSTWTTYCGAACPANGSTVAVVGNTVLDPTNVTSQGAKVTLNRTSTGQFAAIMDNGFNGPAGQYNVTAWVQADPSSPSSIGKKIQMGFLSSSGYPVANYTLTANWQLISFRGIANPAAGCVGANQSCQFQFGLTNQPGNSGPNTETSVVFDIWGASAVVGPSLIYPVVRTVAGPTTSQQDQIAVASGSALETALSGPASSIIMSSNNGLQSVNATVVDSNGTALLKEAADNTLETDVALTLKTSNIGVWTGPVTEGFSRDGSGRSLALNSLIVAKDSQPTVIGTPLYLGSTLGTSNFINGYIGTVNVFNTRVADSQLGVTGTGTNYYFAAAGNDSNPCTLALPCQSITKANTIGLVTNDTMNFNGGDTFPGCLAFIGGANWNATRAAPAIVQSYGTGQATITPNCTAPNSQTAIVLVRNADGMIINNLHFQGDTAGNAGYGILLETCSTGPNGNITIQNNVFNGINHGASPQQYSAVIAVFSGEICNPRWPYDHLVVLNNTEFGASTAATDAPFINNPGYGCAHEWDAIQGNLIYNIGGLAAGPNYFEGTGILINGACPAGSDGNAAPGGAKPNHNLGAGPSVIDQFNVIHDIGANMNACGSYAGNWINSTDSAIIRMNESYNLLGIGGCDHAGFDSDTSTSNSIFERNYSHNSFGPGFETCCGGDTNITFRWNISDADGWHSLSSWGAEAGGSSEYIYNNIFIGAPTTSSVIQSTGCYAAGSLLANNIVVSRQSTGTQIFFSMGKDFTSAVCLPPPLGGLTVTHNDWWSDHGGFSNRFWIATGAIIFATNTGSISGATLTLASKASGSDPVAGALIYGTGVPAQDHLVSCVSTCGSTYPQSWVIEKPATVASEAMTVNTGFNTGTFAQVEALINETGGLQINPLFAGAYSGGMTICNTTSGSTGPQAVNCPAIYHLQSGSSLHAPAGAVLTSQPWNLPINNGGGTWAPTTGQGTLDYWGNVLPCPTVGGFPIGVEC